MIGRIAACVALTVVVAAPLRVEAHHSAVMFDDQKEVTLEGTVKEFQYTNPHSWLLVDVTNKDGSVTTWGFEAEGPSTLLRNGVRPADLKFGTKLKITANPAVVVTGASGSEELDDAPGIDDIEAAIDSVS